MKVKKQTVSLLFGAAYFSLAVNAQISDMVFSTENYGYFGEKLPNRIATFESDNEAETVVKRIVNAVNLVQNFEIRVGGVANAAAIIKDGKRFIIYDQFFMRNLDQQTGTKWAGISVMAHEVGHHLNGHTLDGKGSRPPTELEADIFSGGVLQKMGATLPEARKAMEMLGSPTATETHPAKNDRLAAITKGWITSCNADASCGKNTPLSETQATKNKIRECPAGQVLYSDNQGGISKGEGYCVPCVKPPPGWKATEKWECPS